MVAPAAPGSAPPPHTPPALRQGQAARLWRPATAEHGATGTVLVADGESYRAAAGWRIAWVTLFDAQPAVSEAEYQRRRAAHPAGDFWPL